jgi:ABC-type lipoprotein export system ATPase subunit
VITISGLVFQFPHSDFRLSIPALNITTGERVAVIGPSGSGKTTLLDLVAGILTPSQGMIRVQEQDLNVLSDSALRAFRIIHVGMIFQSFELVSYLDVMENILLPFRLNSALRFRPEVFRRAERLAQETGIAHRLRYFPHRLSQGEKQRVAICRAMLPEPPLILADEPTGNLDPSAKEKVVELLFQQTAHTGATLLMVTHDTEIAARFPRVINCRDFAQEARHA